MLVFFPVPFSYLRMKGELCVHHHKVEMPPWKKFKVPIRHGLVALQKVGSACCLLLRFCKLKLTELKFPQYITLFFLNPFSKIV